MAFLQSQSNLHTTIALAAILPTIVTYVPGGRLENGPLMFHVLPPNGVLSRSHVWQIVLFLLPQNMLPNMLRISQRMVHFCFISLRHACSWHVWLWVPRTAL